MDLTAGEMLTAETTNISESNSIFYSQYDIENMWNILPFPKKNNISSFWLKKNIHQRCNNGLDLTFIDRNINTIDI